MRMPLTLVVPFNVHVKSWNIIVEHGAGTSNVTPASTVRSAQVGSIEASVMSCG